MNKIRSELKKSNKYYISKHRYYELKHFCLQYNEWLQEIGKLNFIFSEKGEWSDPVGDTAVLYSYYKGNIELVNRCAIEADSVLGIYILKAVTNDYSFPYLKTVLDIPCERDMYYDRYRKFFYILSHQKHTF